MYRGAAGANRRTHGMPLEPVPEPMPIAVDPALDARARALLESVTLGQIDRNVLSERLRSFWPGSATTAAAEAASALGAIRDMIAFEQRTTAEGLATYYRAHYASEIWTWIYSVDHTGHVNGFSLRNGRRKIYNIWLRHVEY